MRPMDIDEAWNYILGQYGQYQEYLKKFGYDYNIFIPKNAAIQEMFNKEHLTHQDVEKYKNIFKNNIYDVEKLTRLNEIFENSVRASFERAVNKFLVPLLPSWGATLPKEFEILCAFGRGAGYWRINQDRARMMFRMSRTPADADKILDTVFHEFVHILIEEPIIQKYNVPQDLKERIVDIICFEFIKKPVQIAFENSFANAYINPEVIKTDLPGAVQKMMSVYQTIKEPDTNR